MNTIDETDINLENLIKSENFTSNDSLPEIKNLALS